MSIDFSNTVFIGPKKHDDQFYAKHKSVPGIEATDLFPIYERIGIGTYCDAVIMFEPAAFCSVGENDILCEDGSGLPAETILIAFEHSGASIGVASDGKTATFYTTFRSPDEAYRTPSFELALLKIAEGYGLVELYENPFYVTSSTGQPFTAGVDYRTNVAMVLAAIKDPAKVWNCSDSHKEEESTFILDASKHLLVRVTDRDFDQVTLFADPVHSSTVSSFYDAWHEGFKTKNLTPPQRPHERPHLPPYPV